MYVYVHIDYPCLLPLARYGAVSDRKSGVLSTGAARDHVQRSCRLFFEAAWRFSRTTAGWLDLVVSAAPKIVYWLWVQSRRGGCASGHASLSRSVKSGHLCCHACTVPYTLSHRKFAIVNYEHLFVCLLITCVLYVYVWIQACLLIVFFLVSWVHRTFADTCH